MARIAFPAFILGTLLLSACNVQGEPWENAGKAMAETACLLFDEEMDFTEIEKTIEEKTKAVMKKYGFENPKEIDTYLAGVRGTEELNQVTETARTHLEKECGPALEDSGVTAAELAESMTE